MPGLEHRPRPKWRPDAEVPSGSVHAPAWHNRQYQAAANVVSRSVTSYSAGLQEISFHAAIEVEPPFVTWAVFEHCPGQRVHRGTNDPGQFFSQPSQWFCSGAATSKKVASLTCSRLLRDRPHIWPMHAVYLGTNLLHMSTPHHSSLSQMARAFMPQSSPYGFVALLMAALSKAYAMAFKSSCHPFVRFERMGMSQGCIHVPAYHTTLQHVIRSSREGSRSPTRAGGPCSGSSHMLS